MCERKVNNMKVILLQNVKKIGKKDEIVDVADGYARNFLIPNKLAVMASDKSREILEDQKIERQEEVALEIEKAKEVAKQLEGITLEFSIKAGKDGRIFGSVSTKQIEQELKKEHDITVDKRKFTPSTPISHLGTSRIKVVIYGEVVGEIKVHVSAKE